MLGSGRLTRGTATESVMISRKVDTLHANRQISILYHRQSGNLANSLTILSAVYILYELVIVDQKHDVMLVITD